MSVDLSRLDVPLPEVEADACFLAAAARTKSPSDRLACLLDVKLQHPVVPLSVDADYPGFADWVAAREADNRRAREAK
jgi:hypothetical protein